MFFPIAKININNFRHNIRYLNSLLGNSHLLPVIKANAYGHGYSEIAKVLSEESIKTVCVATYDEILEVLNCSYDLDVLHLGRLYLTNTIVNNNVIFTINTVNDVENINMFCSKLNKKIRCYIKVDTGMNRMGCRIDDFDKIFNLIADSKHIALEGVYSHLACSEDKKSMSNKKQISTFDKIVKKTKHCKLKFHLLNSGGVFNYSEYLYDYGRIGLSSYGISPTGIINENLKPVMKLSAPVILVKNVYKNESIGYGCTYRAKQSMRIALVQCGYADGIPLNFGNKGLVYFKNHELPIVGKISMDIMCIDISNIDKSLYVDEIDIWGGEHVNSRLEVIANKFNSIPYVFLTSLSKRVKRVYFED